MAVDTPAATRPQRPMVLSPDKRKLSYHSKNGNIFTIELKNSKAADSLRDNLKKASTDKNDDGTQVKSVSTGLWDGVYDTIAMMIEESLEIACFGPYDEALK